MGFYHEIIQREKLHDRAHDLRRAVPVAAHAAPADGRAGEVAVGDDQLVAVSHFGDDLEQFGADDRRDSLQHVIFLAF